MAFGKFVREEAWAELRSQVTHLGFSVLWPSVLTTLTLLVGYVQGGVPVAYLIAAGALTFMGLTVGMFYTRELLFQRDPEGKLVFFAPAVGKKYSNIGTSKQKLTDVKFALQYHNTAKFPMEYSVTPLKVSLGSSINPNPVRPVTGGVISAGALGVFTEAAVSVTPEMRGKLVEGQFEMKIDYGRVGKHKYETTRKYKIFIQFNGAGDIASYEPTEI